MLHAKTTHSKVYLMTYASPVTKKMMAFNNLAFFNMPQLPEGWTAPQWLKTELGLLAGRLYFEWHEHETLCKFLGVEDENSDSVLLDGDEDEDDVASEDDDEAKIANEEEAGKTAAPSKRQTVANNSFSTRPLTFLQEWLAIRRHGQDFVHTPMGFLTQGKPLQASHPFFGEGLSTAARPVNGGGLAGIGTARRSSGGGIGSRWGGNGNGDADDGAVFDGVDDMGANVGDEEGDEEGQEVVYDDSEWFDSSDFSASETDSDYA